MMDTTKVYLKDLKRLKLLTKAEEQELVQDMVTNRELLINSNLRLVIFIAKKYTNRGLSLEELIQEGNLGLIRAIDMYKPEQNTRISTYAVSWIRKFIQEAIKKLVRHDTHVRYTEDSCNLSNYEMQNSVDNLLDNLISVDLQKKIEQQAQKLLKSNRMNEKQYKIFHMRVILERSLADIGKEVELSKQRVDQIKNKVQSLLESDDKIKEMLGS